MPEIAPGEIFAKFLPHMAAPTVLVYLNEIKCAAVVDTGSACEALISTELITAILPTFRARLIKNPKHFRDAQGVTLPILGTLPNVSLKINQFITTIQLTVFENQDTKECLLGFPFLKMHDILISKDGLAFKSDYRILRIKEPGQENMQEIFTAEFAIIKGMSQKVVQCDAGLGTLNGKFACFSSVHLQEGLPVSQLQIYFQYQKLSENGKLSLVMSNPSTETLLIPSRKLIAHAEQLKFASGQQIEAEANKHETFQHILKIITDHSDTKWSEKGQTGATFRTDVGHPIRTKSDRHPVARTALNPTQNKEKPQLYTARRRENTSAGKIQGVMEFSDKHSNATQEKITEKLEELEFGFGEEEPLNDKMINCQSDVKEHFDFIKSLVYKYPGITSRHAWDVQHATASVISLQQKPGVKCHRHREIPIALRMQNAADQIIQRLLSLNLIRPSKSPWSSRILFLQKAKREKATRGAKDIAMEKEERGKNEEQNQLKMAEVRIVFDFRATNLALEDSYIAQNIPIISELLQTLRNAKFLGSIDLCQGFWSLAISKRSAEICAFSYRNQLFEPTSLPQGVKSSPHFFQHHLTKIFSKEGLLVYKKPEQDGSYSGIAIYLDNLIIHGLTEQDYRGMLTRFFETAHKYRLKIKLEKSHFWIQDKCILFGYLVDIKKGAFSPDPQKVRDIEAIARPATKRQVRSFCGSLNFFANCVPHLNALLAPLYKVGSHTSKWQWTTECQKSFEAAKRELTALPCVYLLNPEASIWLVTDACVQNHSCFRLYQWNARIKQLLPVGNFSHKLTKTESRYSQHQCELLSCVLFYVKYFNYLASSRINWITDCAALLWASRAKNVNSLVARWWMLLSQQNLRVFALPATDPLLILSDMLTRTNNAVKVTNLRLSKTNIEDIPVISWENLPPFTLEQADRLCTAINKWHAALVNQHPDKREHKEILEKAGLPVALSKSSIPKRKKVYKAKQTDKINMVTNKSENPGDRWTNSRTGPTLVEIRTSGSDIQTDEADTAQNSSADTPPTRLALTRHQSGLKARDCWGGNTGLVETEFPPAPDKTNMKNKVLLCTSAQTSQLEWRLPEMNENLVIYDITDLQNRIHTYFPAVSLNQFSGCQDNDAGLQKLVRRHETRFCKLGGVLCRNWVDRQGKTFFVIQWPDQLALSLVRQLHSPAPGLHYGQARANNTMRRWAHIKKFPQLFQTVIDSCEFCVLNQKNPLRQNFRGPGLEINFQPRNALAIDILCLNTSWGVDVLQLVNPFSLYQISLVISVPHKSQEIIEKIFCGYIRYWGKINWLLRDNEKSLTSSLFDSILTALKVRPVKIAPINSQSNSICEGSNRFLTSILKAMNQVMPIKKEFLSLYLGLANLAYNSMVVRKTNLSPLFCQSGLDQGPVFKTPLLGNFKNIAEKSEYFRQFKYFHELLFQVENFNRAKNQKRQMATDEIRHLRPLQVGDFCLMQKIKGSADKKAGHKLRPRYHPEVYRVLSAGQISALIVKFNPTNLLRKRQFGIGDLDKISIRRVKYEFLKKLRTPKNFPKIPEVTLHKIVEGLNNQNPCKKGYLLPETSRDATDQMRREKGDASAWTGAGQNTRPSKNEKLRETENILSQFDQKQFVPKNAQRYLRQRGILLELLKNNKEIQNKILLVSDEDSMFFNTSGPASNVTGSFAWENIRKKLAMKNHNTSISSESQVIKKDRKNVQTAQKGSIIVQKLHEKRGWPFEKAAAKVTKWRSDWEKRQNEASSWSSIPAKQGLHILDNELNKAGDELSSEDQLNSNSTVSEEDGEGHRFDSREEREVSFSDSEEYQPFHDAVAVEISPAEVLHQGDPTTSRQGNVELQVRVPDTSSPPEQALSIENPSPEEDIVDTQSTRLPPSIPRSPRPTLHYASQDSSKSKMTFRKR
jgi:hypothetical protein